MVEVWSIRSRAVTRGRKDTARSVHRSDEPRQLRSEGVQGQGEGRIGLEGLAFRPAFLEYRLAKLLPRLGQADLRIFEIARDRAADCHPQMRCGRCQSHRLGELALVQRDGEG